MNASKPTRPWRRALAIVITLLALGFFVYRARQHFSALPAVQFNATNACVAAASLALAVAGIVVAGMIWQLLLRDRGQTVTWHTTLPVFLVAQFAKYIPGNVGQHIGRVLMARDVGIPVPVTLSTMLLEALWGVGTAAVLAVSSLLFLHDASLMGAVHLHPALLTVVAAVLLGAPWIAARLMSRFAPGLTRRLSGNGEFTAPGLGAAFGVGCLFLLCFAILGITLKIQANWFFGASAGTVLELTCFSAIAWLAGYLIPGAPGGLGVRESVMLLLLSPMFGGGIAAGLAITLRITTSLGDLVAFGLGFMLRKSSAR